MQVTGPRRRLSVGRVADDGRVCCERPQDRGAITVLSEQSASQALETLWPDNGRTILQILEAPWPDTGRKMSIGSITDQNTSSFADKTTKELGDPIKPEQMALGFTCRKGLKPEQLNQDSWSILKLAQHSIYAVFDGHGQGGQDVSNLVKENLPKLLAKDERFTAADVTQLLVDAFEKMQSIIMTMDQMRQLSSQLAGTTASVCIHDHKRSKLTIGHVADSMCVMGKQSANGDIEGEALTRDHKPNLTDERQRIEEAGGRVVFDGYANHRVYAANARHPGLNMSRCLGDLMGHADCGLSAVPEVRERTITASDRFLLLCSDGIWEFLTPTEAAQIVGKETPDQYMRAAETLAKEAWDRWITNEGGTVVDDITVLIVGMNHAAEPAAA